MPLTGCGLGVVAAERPLQRVRNLAQRAARSRRLDRQRQQVAAVAGARFQQVQRGASLGLVADLAHLLQPRDLTGADPGIVDLEDVEMRLILPAGSG